jgi:hypothetical protein
MLFSASLFAPISAVFPSIIRSSLYGQFFRYGYDSSLPSDFDSEATQGRSFRYITDNSYLVRIQPIDSAMEGLAIFSRIAL